VKIPAGFIELHLDVQKGYIERAKIFGDFFATLPIEGLEEQLIGKRHEINEIEKLLDSVGLPNYFGNVTTPEILELFK